MTHQLFDRLIGEPPPSTVDVDAIVARERKSLWRRRGIALTGTAVATAGIAVVISLIVSGQPAGLKHAPPPGHRPTTASPVEPVDGWIPASEARLSAAAYAAIVRVAPDARLTSTVSAREPMAMSYIGFGRSTEPSPQPTGPSAVRAAFRSEATLRVGDRTAWFYIRLDRFLWPPYLPCDPPTCVESTGPAGERIVLVDDSRPDLSTLEFRVFVERPGNVYVTVIQDIGPDSNGAPLTLDQMVEIARDPALLP